jgi:uncharacterized MAPEG superfamily protein|tara:strand:+ start:471 stop:854 length:384 start_codon:yes stop_codon:yes gene_type:complete
MTTELFYLWMSGLVLIIATLIQQLTSLFNVGLMPVLGSRENVKFTGMTGRLERAILNSIVAMTLITPAIVILHLMEITNASTVLAVQIFLTARIVYIISYGIGIMGLRSAGWTASLLSILWLYYSAI